MKQVFQIALLTLIVSSCQSQTNKNHNRIVGGPCEGCEAIHEYGNKKLSSTDTLPDFQQTEPKIKVTGIVYHKDAKTPAKDVILYAYQTDREGLYIPKPNAKGWAKRHGSIQGWVKTDKDGKYTFYTFRPAAYPNGMEAEHIHITVKEPSKNEYYIDSVVFDDDALLTKSKRDGLEDRGGSGIAKSTFKDGILTFERDIILGLNIPNY